MTGDDRGGSIGGDVLVRVLAYLGTCGIPYTHHHDTRVRDWSLLLLDASALYPLSYPYTWIGEGNADHFILSLQNGLYNDALAIDAKDTEYDPRSVAEALRVGHCIELPHPSHLSWTNGLVARVDKSMEPQDKTTPDAYRVTRPMFLRLHPKKVGPHGALVEKDSILIPAQYPPENDPQWMDDFRWVRVWSGKHTGAYGFALRRNMVNVNMEKEEKHVQENTATEGHDYGDDARVGGTRAIGRHLI